MPYVGPSMTSTMPEADEGIPTAEDILAAIDRAMSEVLIGELMGFPVILDQTVKPNEIEIRNPYQKLRFSIDHPYIQGTAIEQAARKRARG